MDRASRMIEDIVSRSEEEPSPGTWKWAEGPWPVILMGFIGDLLDFYGIYRGFVGFLWDL